MAATTVGSAPLLFFFSPYNAVTAGPNPFPNSSLVMVRVSVAQPPKIGAGSPGRRATRGALVLPARRATRSEGEEREEGRRAKESEGSEGSEGKRGKEGREGG